jgi:hypothetical protein
MVKEIDMVELGSTVKDRITGLVGVVLGRTEYLTGCTHVGISPKKVDTKGGLPDWSWIDERRCIVQKTPRISMSKVEKGGPEQSAPEM